jgi:hypothetical protein
MKPCGPCVVRVNGPQLREERVSDEAKHILSRIDQ